MNPDHIAAAALIIGAGWLLTWGIRKHLAEADANLSRGISEALDVRPEPEQHAGLYDHPPIFAEVERDMGPIFAAGVERQAKRFAAELEDDGGIYDWLRGAS